ncbi:hypothetical protein F5146DRAFT_938877, partial [Armillaria mellea]
SEQGVVLFLVPGADTRAGCIQQAHAYRDAYNNFTEAGYNVYCLSADEPGKQGKWKDKVCSIQLPCSPLFSHDVRVEIFAYNLLSDPKHTYKSLRRTKGVTRKRRIKRMKETTERSSRYYFSV